MQGVSGFMCGQQLTHSVISLEVSDQSCCRVEVFGASAGFRRKLIELKNRKHTQTAHGQSPKVRRKERKKKKRKTHTRSSSSCICLLYCVLVLLKECANISNEGMTRMDSEGGFWGWRYFEMAQLIDRFQSRMDWICIVGPKVVVCAWLCWWRWMSCRGCTSAETRYSSPKFLLCFSVA